MPDPVRTNDSPTPPKTGRRSGPSQGGGDGLAEVASAATTGRAA